MEDFQYFYYTILALLGWRYYVWSQKDKAKFEEKKRLEKEQEDYEIIAMMEEEEDERRRDDMFRDAGF
ncbi:hypothetical protein [Owenweeksia hongkongensis]|uniref:hypothetical protein n=1 Tax=Owenweeksia hongkongensis TaxID=253245 RepID=UPI003A90AC7A